MDIKQEIEEIIRSARTYQEVTNKLVTYAIETESEIVLAILKAKVAEHYGKNKIPDKLNRAIENAQRKCIPLAIEAANSKTVKGNAEIEKLAIRYHLKNDEVSEALMISKVEIFREYIEQLSDKDEMIRQWEEFHCVLWYECSADVMLHMGMADVIKKSRELGSILGSKLTEDCEEFAEGAYKKRYSLVAAISKLRNTQKEKNKK